MAVESPKRPEDRNEQAGKLVTFLGRVKADQIFNSVDNKRQFFENLSFEEFRVWLQRVNGLLRDIPLVRRYFDGADVALVPNPALDNALDGLTGGRPTEYPPRAQDKEDLLKEMFSLSQDMVKKGAAMEDVALLLSAGINAIHLFIDGNGRTSRLVNFLLQSNYSGAPEQIVYLTKLLGENGRLFINVDPGEADHSIWDYMYTYALDIHEDDPTKPPYLTKGGITDDELDKLIQEKIPTEIRADFKRHIFGDSPFGFFAIYSFFKTKGALDEVLTPFTRDGQLIATSLAQGKVLQYLSPQDAKEILETYWDYKKRSVSILLNALAHPEAYKIPGRLNKRTKGRTIKEVYLEKIDGAYNRSFLEVNHESISEIWSERETLPFTTDTFSKDEMQRLCDLRSKLKELIEKETQERLALGFDFEKAAAELQTATEEIVKEDLPVEEDVKSELRPSLSEEALQRIYEAQKRIYEPVSDISKKYLERVIALLDGEDMWLYKFTTRNDRSEVTEAEKQNTDSIYYVTKSRQSLRLRQHDLLKDGMAGVVQPFMEKIFFIDDNANVVDEPVMGKGLFEYATDEFAKAQDERHASEFVSRIRRYDKDGKIVYLNPVDGHIHKGYEIHSRLK